MESVVFYILATILVALLLYHIIADSSKGEDSTDKPKAHPSPININIYSNGEVDSEKGGSNGATGAGASGATGAGASGAPPGEVPIEEPDRTKD